MSVRKSCQSILASEGTDDPTPAHLAGFAGLPCKHTKKAPVLGPEPPGLINKLKSIGSHRKEIDGQPQLRSYRTPLGLVLVDTAETE